MTRTSARAFRAVPIVVGSIAALAGFAVVLAGGVAIWAHETQRDADGYLTTPTEILATPTHALVSGTAQIGVGTTDWIFAPDRLGTIRVHAEGPHGLPIFVGIARAADVEAYLDHVRYDEVTDLSYGPYSVSYRRQEGGAPAGPPGAEPFWVASAQGDGEQVLTWRLADGDWRIVALNPDGSASVEAYLGFGARVAFLGVLGWSLLATGAALMPVGGVLIFVGARVLPTSPGGTPAVPAPIPGPPPAPAERELAGVGGREEER